MFRFLLVLLLLVVGVLAYLWFGSQSMPSWYQGEEQDQQHSINRLSSQIGEQGVANFLGKKFADVMRGEVLLNEDEFNALLAASLASHKDGRRLLRVSDAVRAELHSNELEIGAVINLAKLQKEEPKARKAINKALEVLPFDPGDKIYVAILGKPVARNGNLGLSSDVSLQIGALPIPSSVLKNAGVPVEKVAQESLPLKLLKVRDVTTEKGQIRLAVRPTF